MIRQKWLVGSLALALSAGVTGAAMAQPQTPPGGGGGGGRRGNFQNMTPEQQAAMQAQMQQQRELQTRQQMTTLGITETATQDAVVAFMRAQEARVQPLRTQAQALALALRNPAISSGDLSVQLADFNAAVAAEQTARTAAETALDTQIKYTANARLHTFLAVGGLVGQGAALAGGGGGGRGGRGGMGGFGGGGGGRRGGGGGG